MNRCVALGRLSGSVCCMAMVIVALSCAQSDYEELLDTDLGINDGSGLEATPIVVPDAPRATDSAVGCGQLTEKGECVGNTLRACYRGEVRSVDCDTRFPSPARGRCIYVSAEWGYDCAVEPGGACVYATADGSPHISYCAGKEAGCVYTAEGGECREKVGECVALDNCTSSGDILLECRGWGVIESSKEFIYGQPFAYPCAGHGGKCRGDFSGPPKCVDLPHGASCGTFDSIEFTCGNNLECHAGTCGYRRCSTSTSSGGCTNTSDCAIIDGDPMGISVEALKCISNGSAVVNCITSATGLSNACAKCFSDVDPDRFKTCAGF